MSIKIHGLPLVVYDCISLDQQLDILLKAVNERDY